MVPINQWPPWLKTSHKPFCPFTIPTSIFNHASLHHSRPRFFLHPLPVPAGRACSPRGRHCGVRAALEDKKNNEFPESYPMNGGVGAYSYAQNSKYQRGSVEAAKEMIKEAIVNKFDINTPSTPSNPIFVADLGCSTGPNTFLAVENIVDAIEHKYQLSEEHDEIPEFQVFFNDHSSNDFNTLFKSFPPERKYLAAGVPGSFYGRLFPKATAHVFHSSSSVNWLSRVPKEITEKHSTAWNKGRIHYTNAPKEVVEAYATQHAMDMESFLSARAEELVVGGLMVLLIAAVPEVICSSDTTIGSQIDLLGSCLMDMVKMGLVSEAKVDSINVPLYFPSLKESMAIFERNRLFSIESIEELDIPISVQALTLTLRAALDGVFEEHFGNDMVDEVFDRYSKHLRNDIVDKNKKYIGTLCRFETQVKLLDLDFLLDRNVEQTFEQHMIIS